MTTKENTFSPPKRLIKSHRLQDAIAKTIGVLALIIMSMPFALPMVWMVGSALKFPEQIYVFPPKWIPNPVRLANFPDAWNTAPFALYFRNTIITTFVPMLGEVFVSAIVAYSFARVRWPGRDKLFGLCVATMLMPWVATFIPVFLIFKQLKWINTFLPLIVPAFFGVPYYIFMLRQFMLNLPGELEEAARMDGAGTFKIFFQIIMPLLGPSLATVAIFSFMRHWNDFLMPMIYLQKPGLKTLTLGLVAFESAAVGDGGEQYQFVSAKLNLLMAASCFIALPCVIIFFAFQRYFVRDVLTAGLKM